MRQNLLTLALGALILADLLARLGPALIPTADAGSIEAEPRRHLRCKNFPIDLDEDGGAFDTDDATSEIGQWVSKHEAVGWRVSGSNLEVGQKATGLLQAWTQVCLERSI